MFQICDIYDRYEDGEHVVHLVGRTSEGELRNLMVTNIPHAISVAMGHDVDLDELRDGLAHHLTTAKITCRALGCGCGGSRWGVTQEECAKERMTIPDPVRGRRRIMSRGVYGFEAGTRPFAQFDISHPYLLKEASEFLKGAKVGSVMPKYAGVYDQQSSGVESFMFASGVAGFDWVYMEDSGRVRFADLRKVAKPSMVPAPFVKFGFDIETLSEGEYQNSGNEKGIYPIGLISYAIGKGSEPPVYYSLLLKSPRVTDDIPPRPNLTIFACEIDLLQTFRRVFMATDPDFIIGFNINGFDIPYMLTRASRLGIAGFAYMTRIPTHPMVARKRERSSKGKGVQQLSEISCPGRISLDIMHIAKESLSLNGYSLNEVADNYNLGTKLDMPYEEIFPCFHGTAETRAKLVEYCEHDVFLPMKIEDISSVIMKMIGRCQVLRIQGRDILERGIGYQVVSLYKSTAKEYGYMMMHKSGCGLPIAYSEIDGYSKLYDDVSIGNGYPGAFVFEPVTGIYKSGVVTLDFASLYPSALIHKNICLTTQLTSKYAMDPDQINISPVGFAYVKAEVRKGILAIIEERLLNARAAIRQDMKREEDPVKLRMMDAYQFEMKLAANSIYGQLGTIFSPISLLSGAYSITSLGVYYIKLVFAALVANEDFKRWGLSVIYGDTDSLFINLSTLTTFEDVDAAAKIIVDWVNVGSGILSGRMKMAYEDASLTFLLLAKKRYVKIIGLGGGKVKMKMSGLGKRGMILYGSTAQARILRMAMVDNAGSEQVADAIREVFSDLLMGRVDPKLLIHSTKLSKRVEDYTQDTPGVAAAKQLIDAGRPLVVGDRVKYFFCNGGDGTGRKSGCVREASLFGGGDELDLEIYAEEMRMSFEKVLLHFLPGISERDKMTNLRWIMEDSTRPDIKGAMDGFLNRTTREVATVYPKRYRVTPKTRQLSITDFVSRTNGLTLL